jgi:hypothetical protein
MADEVAARRKDQETRSKKDGEESGEFSVHVQPTGGDCLWFPTAPNSSPGPAYSPPLIRLPLGWYVPDDPAISIRHLDLSSLLPSACNIFGFGTGCLLVLQKSSGGIDDFMAVCNMEVIARHFSYSTDTLENAGVGVSFLS